MQSSNLWWLETEASYRSADLTAASRTPRRPRRRSTLRFPSPATNSRIVDRRHSLPAAGGKPAANAGIARFAESARPLQHVNGDCTTGFRVILTTGLATLYLAGCLAALSLLLSMWGPSL
jgi:hypothetical protein